MPAFQLRLYDQKRTVIGNSDFETEDILSALKVAYRIFEICHHACAGYELWQGGTQCISSAMASVRRFETQLSEFEQQLAIDTEIALQDSARLIAQSRTLIAAIDENLSISCAKRQAQLRAGAKRTASKPTGGSSLRLSERERECMQLAARGMSDREIGRAISLSEKTVNEYIERVKRKLDTCSRVEAIVQAVKLNLIDS